MNRRENYGKIGVANLPAEVLSIWYSKDKELPEAGRFQLSTFYIVDMSSTDRKLELEAYLRGTPLTEREQAAIALSFWQGCTLEEIGNNLGSTKERSRQILDKALRKIRMCAHFEFGEKCY